MSDCRKCCVSDFKDALCDKDFCEKYYREGSAEDFEKLLPHRGREKRMSDKDTIYRQAAIDALADYIRNVAKVMGTGHLTVDDCKDAAHSVLEELPSAQTEQRWIPCSERMPEDLEEVNVTWVNHDPEPYYNFVKDKPFTATAVYYKEKWYWYSSTCADLLAEYGRNPNEEIDDGIEIIAWMPLPKPWRGNT